MRSLFFGNPYWKSAHLKISVNFLSSGNTASCLAKRDTTVFLSHFFLYVSVNKLSPTIRTQYSSFNSGDIDSSRIWTIKKKKKCCEVGPWRSHKLRLFSPLLTPLFHEHSHRVFGVLLYAISESFDTGFAGQVVYKPWVLSVSSEAVMLITAILIPAADCVLMLHQLVIGPVTVHLM